MSVKSQWNMACPKCRRDDCIDIVASVTVRLAEDGTDTDASSDQSHEWGDTSVAGCKACGHIGTVREFRSADAVSLPGLDGRETAAVLAGLRLVQRELSRGEFLPQGVHSIFDEDGAIEPLDADEIDDLCERING
mgnify:CR=1 FL=1|tara:strand:+ start:6796 stop:7200 length:405 start_codon:yes stop_codon:yes gene_type:complete